MHTHNIHTYSYLHIHTYIHIHTHLHVNMHIHIIINIHIQIHIQIHIHTYIHACMHTYIHRWLDRYKHQKQQVNECIKAINVYLHHLFKMSLGIVVSKGHEFQQKLAQTLGEKLLLKLLLGFSIWGCTFGWTSFSFRGGLTLALCTCGLCLGLALGDFLRFRFRWLAAGLPLGTIRVLIAPTGGQYKWEFTD